MLLFLFEEQINNVYVKAIRILFKKNTYIFMMIDKNPSLDNIRKWTTLVNPSVENILRYVDTKILPNETLNILSIMKKSFSTNIWCYSICLL